MRGEWDALRKPLPERSRAERASHLALQAVLLESGGVDRHTLANLVALKNALAEEFLAGSGGEDRPTQAFIDDCLSQFEGLAGNHSAEIRAREGAAAREAFCRRQGIRVG